jgi:hypothetical protein
VAKGKARQQWLFKPDRTRTIDADFLNFLDEARRELASDLIRQNDRADLLEGTRLNEAVQRILDRLLFLRICEDRDIDTGRPLASILKFWRSNADDAVPRRVRPSKLFVREDDEANKGKPATAPRVSLWREVVAHFRALDHRPASQIPFFNGNLFKFHFSEDLVVGEEWLAHFLDEIGDEESAYLFNYIPVEILGIIYERFLGKIVRPQGRGVAIEEKPEVRKAGGVYYTPHYIVEYIVAQTVGKLLEGRSLDEALQLKILDPACGSGSFLIHAFEVVSEYYQQWLTDHRDKKRKDWYWVEENAVHLTAKAKRQILCQTIHGVDIDPQAVEVTQLSLYLKMLEGENRATLAREQKLFGSDEALLPALEDNIKCGNSLIASNFSIVPDDLVRVHAFDWDVQFSDIMKAGGFDAVIGNPPYIRIQRVEHDESDYLFRTFQAPTSKIDLSLVFLEKSLLLAKRTGLTSFICTSQWLTTEYGKKLRGMLSDGRLRAIVDFGSLPVFDNASTYPAVFALSPTPVRVLRYKRISSVVDLNLEGIADAPEREVVLASLSEAPWILGAFDLIAMLRRSNVPYQPLSAFGGAYIGCKTGMNGAFVLSRKDAAAKQIESGVLFPYALRGEEILRYEKADPGFVVIYPYRELPGGELKLIPEAEMKKKFPRAFLHLVEFKSLLRKRQDSRRSYADGQYWYRHLRPGNFGYIRNTKLVFKAISREMAGGLLAKDTAFDGANCPAILLENLGEHDPRYLLGILNSRLLSKHLRVICPPKLSGYVKFTANGLSAAPMRVIDFSSSADRAHHNKMVALVNKMLALTPKLRAAKAEAERKTLQNAVTATDRQIDALVYELYGLTKDEIELVEGTS